MGKQVFMHAADAHDDPKCMRIIKSHGMTGYGVIWFLVEQMRRDDSLKISSADLDLYAYEMCVSEEDLKFILKTALQVGFFIEEDGFISAPALQRDIDYFEQRRDEWRQRQRKHRASRNVTRDINDSHKMSKRDEEEEEEVEEEVEEEEAEEAKPETPPNGNGHKKPPPKFDPTGKTKYLDWVYLSPEQLESVKSYYSKRGLGPEEFQEAVRELDRWFSNNPKMRDKRTDDAKALKGWPLDAALRRKRELSMTLKMVSGTR